MILQIRYLQDFFIIILSFVLGTTTQVKIVILPTPAQPEPVGGESITHRLPGGDEVEGSGSEGHLPIIPTTPNGGHEGQGHGNEGHLVALTTTPHENHEAEGSGSGSQGEICFVLFLTRRNGTCTLLF